MESKGNFLSDLFGKELSAKEIKKYTSELQEKKKIPFIHFTDDGLKDELVVVDENGYDITSINNIFEEIDYPLNRGPFFYASNYELNYGFKTWIIFTQDGLIIEDPQRKGEITLYAWEYWGDVLYTKHAKMDAPVILLANPTEAGVLEISISPVPDLKKNVKIGKDGVARYDDLTIEEMNLAFYILKTFWAVVEENRKSDNNEISLDIFSLLNKKDFKTFNEEIPEDISFLEQGEAKLKIKDFQGAIEDFNKVLIFDPNNNVAYAYRGDAYLEIKNYQSAIENYDKSLKINPTIDFIYQNRGDAKKSLNDFQGAIDDYTKAIEIDAEWWAYYLKRADVKSTLKDYDSAIMDYNKVIELNPDYKWAYQNRGKAKLGLNDNEGAIQDFSKVIELDPAYKGAYQQRAIAKSNLEDYQGVIEDCSTAIELDPNNRWNYFKRGDAKSELKDYKGGIEDFTSSVEIDPNYDWGYYSRGLAKNNLKDYKGAIEDYTKALEINAEWWGCYMKRADVKSTLKEYQSAIEDYNKVIELNPENKIAHQNRDALKELLIDKPPEVSNSEKETPINKKKAVKIESKTEDEVQTPETTINDESERKKSLAELGIQIAIKALEDSTDSELQDSKTVKGNVLLFSDFDSWISEMRKGQKENKNLGLKKRNLLNISIQDETILRSIYDKINLKYGNEEGLLSFSYSPTSGCTVSFNNRKVSGFGFYPKGNLGMLILRDYKKDYIKPDIKNLNVQNINETQISYQVPWGYAFFQVIDSPKNIGENVDVLIELIGDGINTIKDGKVLSLKKNEFPKLKPIFEGT
jgi:tetratricopeptide (TPR) repeat protein